MDAETNDWVAVYYTDDGPFVYGPFASEEAARNHILDFYREERGITDELEALKRYSETGDEWITRLQPCGGCLEASGNAGCRAFCVKHGGEA